MTNEQLVALIQEKHNVSDNMLALWQQNKGLIASIALKYAGYEELEDLKQQGYIGLCSAVEGYNASEGVPFANYAAFWIRQSMQRYIDECGNIVRLPSGTRELLTRYRRFTAVMVSEYGREPSNEEVQNYLGISESSMERLHKAELIDRIKSIDLPISEDSDCYLYDMIPGQDDTESQATENVELQKIKAVLWELVEGLPGQQPDIIKARYQEEMTMKAVGELLDISRSEVRALHDKALVRLRTSRRSPMLKSFMYDYIIDTEARKGIGVRTFNRSWTSATERVAIKI